MILEDADMVQSGETVWATLAVVQGTMVAAAHVMSSL